MSPGGGPTKLGKIQKDIKYGVSYIIVFVLDSTIQWSKLNIFLDDMGQVIDLISVTKVKHETTMSCNVSY